MTRERRIELFKILVDGVSVPLHPHDAELVEKVIENDEAMNILFSFITMYAAEEPNFLQVLNYTIEILKNGTPDTPTH